MDPKRLRERRKAKGLTQDQLAKKVNTKKTTISNYETGYSTPSNEMLSDLADVLETTTDFLLGRTKISESEHRLAEEFSDPDLQIAFREASDFSEEAKQQAIDFIKYLKEKEKKRNKTN
ncbi:helix-turn-helix domain-containing protein [Bacillus haynesii]|uniref:helix-turn-helix domain-containing protein n=1 Tax=Bacillus haynesii TaxID=1925021 RepID=UPI002280F377|nr:helix-turn-helix transcriptional regulator [Bacillus haynesii]MCY8009738.1 helix-turn-helix domain-containing protein [Bacillus haynesii]